MKLNRMIILGALVCSTAHAAVTVSDFGSTVPTVNPSTDTGYTGLETNEFSLDGTDTMGQSFRVPATGIVDKVYFAYDGFGRFDPDGLVNFTFRLDVGNDGIYEINQAFTGIDRANFLTTFPAPHHWIEFDLSSENISLAAGVEHAVWWNSDQASGVWVAAPDYVRDTNPYADGKLLGTFQQSGLHDALFVVTTVPEPAAGLLAGLGLLGLLRRRRA